jgi:hypothetical protein
MHNLNYIHQQLWGYKVEDKLHLGVREQKRLNITALGRLVKNSLKRLKCKSVGKCSAPSRPASGRAPFLVYILTMLCDSLEFSDKFY